MDVTGIWYQDVTAASGGGFGFHCSGFVITTEPALSWLRAVVRSYDILTVVRES
jgi:hypothetical protein